MSRPRIAIAGVTRQRDGIEMTGVNANYVRSVIAAGGLPVIITPELDPGCAVELFGECDALLLTGGEDVDPARYGAAPHAKLGGTSTDRDSNEIALIADARVRDLPILGICRGIQILNVSCGGTLVQDLASERPSDVIHDHTGARDLRSHAIAVEPGSRLATILGEEHFDANSFHHQAVDTLGSGLIATAHAPDGVVEAVESRNAKEWLIAVQWHPEELALHPDAADLKLFTALITAARRGT